MFVVSTRPLLQQTIWTTALKNISPGRKCGASRIDDAFLKFLKERLGEDYDRLTSSTGSSDEVHGQGAHVVLRRKIQAMLRDFQSIKHGFKGPPGRGQPDAGEVLALMDGIGEDNDASRGIQDGELHISR